MAFDIPLIWHRNAPGGDACTLTLTNLDGTPFDLTGYTFEMQGRQYPGAPDPPYFTLGMAAEDEPGFFLLNAVGGVLEITPPSAATLQALGTAPDSLMGKVAISIDIVWTAPDDTKGVFAYGKTILYTGVTVP